MLKARALLFPLLLCLFFTNGVFSLFAQEYDDEEDYPDYDESLPFDTEWDDYPIGLYSRGDQAFTISLGINFPTLFLNNGKILANKFTPPVGGMLGPMAYNYFFSSHFFVGAEIGFSFNATVGQNMLFIIPIGLRAGWQFVLRRFEIPLILTVGMVPQRYIDNSYFGFFMKGGVSVFYRFSPEWSFGMNTDWSWYPQRPLKDGSRDREKNADGNFIGLTLSARYHF